MLRCLVTAAMAAGVLVALPAAQATAGTVPAGFQEQVVFSGLDMPTKIQFAPDGRVFVAEYGGVIKVFESLADPTPSVFADLSTVVHGQWDRGLLGMTLPPTFPANPYVYVLYAYDAPPGQTAPVWNDFCSNANDGNCVVTSRLSRLRADGNVMTGAEEVLIHDWCQQFPSHSTGDVAFGPDGALYVSGGDGASFSAVDWGRFGNPTNPCNDPPAGVGGTMSPPTAEGGALRSQDVRSTADPTGLDGTVLRLDPATGQAAAGNPLAGSADANARRIVAHGLRNPMRLAFRPGTSELWVGDVGWNAWEEVNRVVNPTSATTNFGWPCYEGAGRMGSYDNANLNLCESLYAAGTSTAPYYAYNHTGAVVTGENCGNGGDAISGMAFYPYSGGSYPAAYRGALFFADYSRGCVWAMKPATAGGLPSTSNIEPFVQGGPGAVDLQIGPGGELYYADLIGGTVRRVRYFPGNQPPVAAPSATPTTGAAPLTVSFDGTASTDADPADQGLLTYAWDFTNDGTVDATTPTATHTYTSTGTFTAALTVSDTLGATDRKTVTVTSGSTAPTAVIDNPSAGLTWAVGDTVTFSGHATDPQQGSLPPSALRWTLRMHHCETATNCHVHELQQWNGVASGSFVAPDHEYPSYLELTLSATDDTSLTHTASRQLDPRTVDLTFASDPSGLQVSVGAATLTTPFTRTVIQGSTNTVSAPSPQTLAGTVYAFGSWSDGGQSTHVITAPAAPTTYTVTYAGDGAGCADSFGYTCAAGATPFVAADQTVLPLTGDDAFTQIALPFTVPLYGQSYSTAWVDTNGVLSFLPLTASAWEQSAIPSPPGGNRANAALYPFWDDWRVDASASVRTAVTGSAPHRRFIVEWRNVRHHSSSSARVTFEAVIEEGTGVVTFAYKDISSSGLEQGNSATIGIENADGTVALQYSHNQPIVRTGHGVTFTPPGTTPPPPTTGVVRGTVALAGGGGPVAGLAVRLTGAGLTTTTAADGSYTFTAVPPGTYTVTASRNTRCAAQADSRPVTVTSGQTVTVDLALAGTPLSDSFGNTCADGATAFLAADQTVLPLTGDDAFTQIALPFPVRLYGQAYSSAWVDTNGVISFVAPTGSSWDQGAIPSPASPNRPNAAVYPFWDDLRVDAAASVRTAVTGAAGSRRFVVEWRNVRHYSSSSVRLSFEAVFAEDTGAITFAYKDIAAVALEQGGSATVGIENANGTVALQYSFNEPVLTSGHGVTISPPS